MHQKLILEVFKKSKEINLKKTGREASDTKIAEKISESLLDDYKIIYGFRSLKDIYKEAVKDANVTIKKPEVINGLSMYLGYINYEDFVDKNFRNIQQPIKPEDPEESKNGIETLIHSIKKHKTKLSISVVTLLFAIIMYNALNKQRWMVWDKNEYIEVNYNIEKDKAGTLQPYDKNLIKYFRKIPYTFLKSCEIPFFDKSGNPAVWYYKNKKELELFTQAGKHPENGETLKKITPYMIRKYICEKY